MANSEEQVKKMLLKIQSIIFPKTDICPIEELYFRLNSKCSFNYEQNQAELNQGGVITFNTYFNSFSADKWQAHTNVKAININLILKGAFKVRLLNIDYFSKSAILVSQKVITADNLDKFSVFENIDIQQYKGLLYLEIEALEHDCLFTGGYFSTSINNREQENIKFALVICTYKREAYVYKNVQLIEKYLINQADIAGKLDIFIIDNGRSLENFDNPNIHLLYNKNAGGSGGFTRGIMEVIKLKNQFSHIIFMDDDVLIDPEVIERIYRFFIVSNDKDLCLGSSMLRLDTKYIQHEKGAIWSNEFVPIKSNLDLRKSSNILFNEYEEYIDYSAWWLFCFPTKTLDNSKLPYPFFIRMDDVEFCMRLKQKIVILNGICVWHEPFENKHSPSLLYYDRRNGLIMSALYFDKFGRLNAVKWFLKPVLRHLACYRYATAAHILKAIADFIKGPGYISSIDPENKHKEVLKVEEKPVKNPKSPFIYSKYIESVNQTETSLHRFFRMITLNGHILPSTFFHSQEKITDKGYRVVPSYEGRALNAFRAKTILYYNLATQEGFAVKISRINFFKIITKAIFLAIVLYWKFPKLKKLYRQTLPELTNLSFWEKYLEINNDSNHTMN